MLVEELVSAGSVGVHRADTAHGCRQVWDGPCIIRNSINRRIGINASHFARAQQWRHIFWFWRITLEVASAQLVLHILIVGACRAQAFTSTQLDKVCRHDVFYNNAAALL